MATNPQAEGMTKLTFQLSEDEKEQLKQLARAAGVTMSQYIRWMLSEHLQSGNSYRPSSLPTASAAMARATDDEPEEDVVDKFNLGGKRDTSKHRHEGGKRNNEKTA